jgi:prepilin-type N-terminal cleavage/methylation domain-containing protein
MKRRNHRALDCQGMSLLEMLAALVILSAGTAVAFTWFNQSANALSKVKEQEALLLATQECIEQLQHINPQNQPNGTLQMSGYVIEWRSQSIAPEVNSITDLGMRSRYRVGLYSVNVTLFKDGRKDKPWTQLSLQLASYYSSDTSSTNAFGGLF